MDAMMANMHARGHAGSTFGPTNIALCEVQHSSPEFAYLECVPKWNVELMETNVGKEGRIVHFSVRGKHHGDRYDRHRLGEPLEQGVTQSIAFWISSK